MTSPNQPAGEPMEGSDKEPGTASGPASTGPSGDPAGADSRVPTTPGTSDRRGSRLSTVGELVEAGGNRGALGILAYLVIGTAFWSLVGLLLDYLVGTQWLVLLGAGLGLAAGVTLAYLHLQAGLGANDGSAAGDDARNRTADSHHRDHGQGPAGGSRKDRH